MEIGRQRVQGLFDADNATELRAAVCGLVEQPPKDQDPSDEHAEHEGDEGERAVRIDEAVAEHEEVYERAGGECERRQDVASRSDRRCEGRRNFLDRCHAIFLCAGMGAHPAEQHSALNPVSCRLSVAPGQPEGLGLRADYTHRGSSDANSSHSAERGRARPASRLLAVLADSDIGVARQEAHIQFTRQAQGRETAMCPGSPESCGSRNGRRRAALAPR